MNRSTVLVTRGRFGSAAGRVLEQARGGRLLTRDQLGRATGLSPASVTRSVTALVDGGLLRERPDRTQAGANGRPGVPVEIDPDEYVVLGVHLGTRVTTVALGDLDGRTLACRRRPRNPEDHRAFESPDFEWVAGQAMAMLHEVPRRVPLGAGLVAPFAELGLDPRRAGTMLEEVLGLEVTTSDHVAAVAAAEVVHRRGADEPGGTTATAYLYVRNTAGFAVALENDGAAEVSRVANLAHFPTGSPVRCTCGRTGCLQATASDHAVAHAARTAGLVQVPEIADVRAAAADGVLPARRLLVERARILGQAAAVVRDMVAPDRMVLVGQAFTDDPLVRDEVASAFGGATALPPIDLSFTRFGTDVQSLAACTIAAAPVYADPLAALPAHRVARTS